MPEVTEFGVARRAGSYFAEAVRRLAPADMAGDFLRKDSGVLPPELSRWLKEMIDIPDPDHGFLVIRGLFDEFADPGPTPLHWSQNNERRTAEHDIGLITVAATLGSVFGWTNQQDGRIVHDILPSPGHENMQVGASSAVPLAWHTEDGFHPERADLLILLCLRNPDGVGTRLANIRHADIGDADLVLLEEPLLVIEPDDSYGDATDRSAPPVGMATVWARNDGPCVRYDPSYTRMLTDDGCFLEAYGKLGAAFEECGRTVSLDPGDLLIVDNDTVVHGRVAFRPRYDGTDRWLKRVLVRTSRPRPARESLEHGYMQVRVPLGEQGR
ncbi:TauD/TfdA family dioxygenase [Streptosporangium sandarakinum]